MDAVVNCFLLDADLLGRYIVLPEKFFKIDFKDKDRKKCCLKSNTRKLSRKDKFCASLKQPMEDGERRNAKTP